MRLAACGFVPRGFVRLLAVLLPLSGLAQTAANPEPAPANAATTTSVAAPAMMVLLLPATGSSLERAADALRRGFLAARQADGDRQRIQVIETDESPEQVAAALKLARERGARVVVGPLTRAAVNAAAATPLNGLLIVTLNQPDNEADAPAGLLAFGAGTESEARRLLRAALAGPGSLVTGVSTSAQRYLVVTGGGAWARRSAQVFRQGLEDAGQKVVALEPAFDTDGLVRFSERLKGLEYDGAFLALDAREAALIRPRLRRDAQLFATSQVYLGEAAGRALAKELTGIRFVDMPWLLEPDHPAVMIYGKPETLGGALPTAELSRLFALGIDAYRVANAWADGQRRFEIDGVTGYLRVDRDRSARVDRSPSFAVFRGGKILREDPPQ